MNTIFITGAGAGIGLATARLFAGRGWFVGAADRDARALESLGEELGGDRYTTHVIDVCDAAAVREALAAFSARTGGRLQVLHNNAGVLKVGPFEAIDTEEHRRLIEVNLIGLVNVLHGAFPYLRDTPEARVVNMSSASAVFGIPDFATYSATKHAVRGLTEALSIEWERHGIQVSDLMPPFVDTGMVQANAGTSRIIDRLGVDLSAEEVAGEVWNLVHAPMLHRPITLPLRALWPIARALPTGVTRRVLRKLWK